jgi:hypothetical protein
MTFGAVFIFYELVVLVFHQAPADLRRVAISDQIRPTIAATTNKETQLQ